ncbi:MAG: ABC transporter permease subunit [Candidatus Schekmanbacteria bacterium]|nr:ABC transporter permease subunit [Candidatus Schekmanbacteria bacterium]
MLTFILRRLLWMIPVLGIIATITFFFVKSVPGGPFDAERRLPPAIERNIRARYKLDDPIAKQYVRYMGNLLRLDLGPSFKYRSRSVNEIIIQAFPVSVTLGVAAMTIALLVGLSAGVVAAVRHNTAIDYAAMAVAMIGVSIPNFVLGPILLILLVFLAGALPVAGWGTPSHVVLPAMALSAPYAAYVARLTRAGMLEVIRKDYIRTAWSKGLDARRVVLGHALKNAILPVISYLGPASAGIVTGSLVVERIFHVPGIGTFFINGALARDYTVVMGTTLLYSSLLVFLNLVVDIAYAYVDPRIELG